MIMAHEFSRLQSTYVLVAKKTASRLGTTATWSPGAVYVSAFGSIFRWIQPAPRTNWTRRFRSA